MPSALYCPRCVEAVDQSRSLDGSSCPVCGTMLEQVDGRSGPGKTSLPLAAASPFAHPDTARLGEDAAALPAPPGTARLGEIETPPPHPAEAPPASFRPRADETPTIRDRVPTPFPRAIEQTAAAPFRERTPTPEPYSRDAAMRASAGLSPGIADGATQRMPSGPFPVVSRAAVAAPPVRLPPSLGEQPFSPDDEGAILAEVARAQNDPQRLFGRYLLLREIGEGGMGVVYQAWHTVLRRLVALKLLHRQARAPDAVERFEREAQAALEGNVCRENASAGLVFQEDAQGTATGNVCVQNGKLGIDVRATAQPTLRNNVTSGNKEKDVSDERR